MPEELFANVASTTTSASITSGQTSFAVVSSANFPVANTLAEQQFHAAFVDTATPPNILEFFTVTNVTGTTWTVQRASEDPTRFPAAARASGTRIVMVVTRGVLESFERRSRAVGHNVLDYGAIGNSSHSTYGAGADDTAEIQAAYDDAASASGLGFVVFPGRRTYRITSTINVNPGTYSIGYGSRNAAGIGSTPTVVWGGPVDGLMFDVVTSSPNITSTLFENMNIRGAGGEATGYVNAPDCAIKFRHASGGVAKLDSGTALRNIWLQVIKGTAVQILGGGSTNFWIQGGRWDLIGGFAVEMLVTSHSIFSISDVTWDSGIIGSKGFLHLNVQDPGHNGAFVLCHLDTIHPEVNVDLTESEPGGADPADRAGIIVCTITPTSGMMQHFLTMDNIQLLGSGGKTHSMVLMRGGTPDQNKARLSLNGRNVRGFSGNGTAASGQRIPVGGIPTADKSPYTTSHYSEIRFWPGGTTLFGSETPRSYSRVSAP